MTTDGSDPRVTEILDAMGRGEDGAADALWEMVYDSLHDRAVAVMGRERSDHTLQPTALVHEVYARLVGSDALSGRGREYFYGAAAQAMRRILIEHARKVSRRSNQLPRADLTLDALSMHGSAPSPEDLQQLEAALDALAEHDRRTYDVVMLRFFCGLSLDATAETLGTSTMTVKRCWRYGRAWLYDRIADAAGASSAETADG